MHNLDGNSRYWQIKMVDKDVYKTAIFTYNLLLMSFWMPFDLKNATETFQRARKGILYLIKSQNAIVYINEVINFSKLPEHHLQLINEKFCLFCDALMAINLKKCFFFSKENEFMVNVIDSEKLQVAERTIKAIKSIQ